MENVIPEHDLCQQEDVEWLEEIEVQEPQIYNLQEAIEKAFKRFKSESLVVPVALMINIFKFEKDDRGIRRLKTIDAEWWIAIRLYLLLQFLGRKEGKDRFVAGIRYLRNGLGCSYQNLKKGIIILKRANLIKTYKKGKSSRAIKHYVTLIKG